MVVCYTAIYNQSAGVSIKVKEKKEKAYFVTQQSYLIDLGTSISWNVDTINKN